MLGEHRAGPRGSCSRRLMRRLSVANGMLGSGLSKRDRRPTARLDTCRRARRVGLRNIQYTKRADRRRSVRVGRWSGVERPDMTKTLRPCKEFRR